MSTININKAIQRILLFLRGGTRALETVNSSVQTKKRGADVTDMNLITPSLLVKGFVLFLFLQMVEDI